MAINIQNIVNALQAKISAADSSDTITELGRLAQANRVLGELQNAVRHRRSNRIPVANQYDQGRMIWDSESNEFLLSYNYRWNPIDLADSDAVYQGPPIQGSIAGFTIGGAPPAGNNDIQRYPFATDEPATDVGSMPTTIYTASGSYNDTYGFVTGNFTDNTSILYLQMANTVTVTGDAGDLTSSRQYAAGHSDKNASISYVSGGEQNFLETIDRFPQATTTTATSIGNLSRKFDYHAGQSDVYGGNGYAWEGYISQSSPVLTNDGNKWPFAASVTTTVLTGGLGVYGASGISTSTDGYIINGQLRNPPRAYQPQIRRFPFASDVITTPGFYTYFPGAARYAATSSSQTHGYLTGGVGQTTAMHKFPFNNDANSVSIGTLVVASEFQGAGVHQ